MPTVPIVHLRTLESYVERIEAICRDAAEDELGTLAYLLECAKLEAQNQVDAGAREKAARSADPDNLWRPVIDR